MHACAHTRTHTHAHTHACMHVSRRASRTLSRLKDLLWMGQLSLASWTCTTSMKLDKEAGTEVRGTCTHIRMYAYTHTHAHTLSLSQTHTYHYSLIHTRTHARTHTHTSLLSHTHMLSLSLSLCPPPSLIHTSHRSSFHTEDLTHSLKALMLSDTLATFLVLATGAVARAGREALTEGGWMTKSCHKDCQETRGQPGWGSLPRVSKSLECSPVRPRVQHACVSLCEFVNDCVNAGRSGKSS